MSFSTKGPCRSKFRASGFASGMESHTGATAVSATAESAAGKAAVTLLSVLSFAVLPVILLYFIGKKQENGHSIRELILAQPLPIRWAIYIIPIVLIIIAGAYGPGWGVADFIYAKF